ncbi:hypothetical protein BDN72DRAFT_94932 [Pluteus cervinus]|uniref:Uncharacterized protein n=1 Tax=Pluteus cervinus TaxID=181527 RepID=A0ACD3AP64_9AGAR|nr:hypothetical protein BDN72DRAFT_94932 [Pluteus cervinus]
MPHTSAQNHHSHSYLDAQRKIDAEISELKARIVSLKASRNALAPISQLHSEILQEIFLFVHQGSHPKGNGSLLVTWISRAWRELAHHTINLWTSIDLTHPDAIQAALARTKSCDLHFRLGCRSRAEFRRLTSSLPFCLQELGRTKTLVILCRNFILKGTDAQWTAPAPILTELRLRGAFLSPNMFSGTCPSLQILDLSLCAIDWETFPAFSNLKSLRIGSPRPNVTVDNIMTILREPIHYPQPSLDRVPLPLDNLRLFSLDDRSLNNTKALLKKISLPRHATTQLGVYDWGNPAIADTLLASRNISQWEIFCLDITADEHSVTVKIRETELNRDSGTTSTSTASTCTPSQVTHTFLIHDGAEASNWFAYFAGPGTVRELSVDSMFFSDLIASFQEQDDRLRAVLGAEEELGESLNQEEVTMGRPIITFQHLQGLRIGGGEYPVRLRDEVCWSSQSTGYVAYLEHPWVISNLLMWMNGRNRIRTSRTRF